MKIKTLAELGRLARMDERYARLAMDAARNLGGSPTSVDSAMRWLYTNANETDDEQAVVDEVNFCL